MGTLIGSPLEADEKIVDQVLSTLEKPSDVLDVSYELGEDSDGMPEIWLWILTTQDASPSDAKVGRLNFFSNKLRDGLLDRGVKGWPHIRIHEVVSIDKWRRRDVAGK